MSLASTAAKVIGWYHKTRLSLDSPIGFQIDTARQLWEVVPSARARETLLTEVATVGVALSRLDVRSRLILECRYDPQRGATDKELSRALHCDRDGAREAHQKALVALGEQLVKAGLVSMNGKPKWRPS